jgi:hypothetical protein
MVRGFCSRCGKKIGGPFQSVAWQCVKCMGVWCEKCPTKKVGWFSKKLLCPDCGIEMYEGGVPIHHRSLWS